MNELNAHIRPVRKISVTSAIVSQIKDLIDSGALVPGGRLPGEREFARLLNVSRPSLREALRALNLLGVLENRPGSGTYLRASEAPNDIDPLSILLSIRQGTLQHVIEARQALETTVAELAAGRRTDGDLQALGHALEAMRSNLEDPEAYHRHELEFHRCVWQAAANPVITDLMTKIYRILTDTRTALRRYREDPADFIRRDFRAHEEIYDCIRGRNRVAARRTMRRHIQLFKKSLDGDMPRPHKNENERTHSAAAK